MAAEYPQFKERAVCGKCECLESMEHILLDCESTRRKAIWKLTEKAWAKNGEVWRETTLGTILGHG
ncbi:hypothetical protein BU17DRAFT_55680 [Hysterangium stoloniferum]|nr:hypothetical protein BU17DRAFT_55680 [Hysterangium stoloniferum]